MISSMILVKNNQIAYTRGFKRPNEAPHLLSFDSMMTEYGLFIPFAYDAFMLLDYLETGVWVGDAPEKQGDKECRYLAAILTKDSVLIKFILSYNGIYCLKIPLRSVHDSLCFSNDFISETHGATALYLTSTQTIEDAIDALTKIGWKTEWFAVACLSELVIEIENARPTKPIPMIPCSRRAFAWPRRFSANKA